MVLLCQVAHMNANDVDTCWDGTPTNKLMHFCHISHNKVVLNHRCHVVLMVQPKFIFTILTILMVHHNFDTSIYKNPIFITLILHVLSGLTLTA